MKSNQISATQTETNELLIYDRENVTAWVQGTAINVEDVA